MFPSNFLWIPKIPRHHCSLAPVIKMTDDILIWYDWNTCELLLGPSEQKYSPENGTWRVTFLLAYVSVNVTFFINIALVSNISLMKMCRKQILLSCSVTQYMMTSWFESAIRITGTLWGIHRLKEAQIKTLNGEIWGFLCWYPEKKRWPNSQKPQRLCDFIDAMIHRDDQWPIVHTILW